MRMGHLKHSGLDWMVGMLIAKLSVVYIYTNKVSLNFRIFIYWSYLHYFTYHSAMASNN